MQIPGQFAELGFFPESLIDMPEYKRIHCIRMKTNLTLKIVFTALVVVLAGPRAAWAITVDEVLAYQKAPYGVVFEIISGDKDELERALPKVRADMQRLKSRFPDISIAVVSHGKEQFALTSDNESEYKETHDVVRSMIADKNVSFHVCGTFASMNNVDENEFPDYVDVAPHGPMQIKNYVEFGYLKILVE